MIDPTFRNINRFVLSFKNGDSDPERNSFDKHYMPLVEFKDFNALIDNKPFFWSSRKEPKRSVWKTWRNVKKWWRYNRTFIGLLVSSKFYRLIGIYLSRQANAIIPRQINFVGKLEKDDGATMFFNFEKQQKAISKFSLDSLSVTE